jgi:hypothetical protein
VVCGVRVLASTWCLRTHDAHYIHAVYDDHSSLDAVRWVDGIGKLSHRRHGLYPHDQNPMLQNVCLRASLVGLRLP